MLAALLLAACGPGESDDDTDAFGCETPCPAGTAAATSQQIAEGYDLDAGLDPADYSGEIAYRAFVDGECSWTCATLQGCPPDTFPVITADCFTCAALVDGEVVQGGCGA